MGKKDGGIEKYRLVVTKQSWGCQQQHKNVVYIVVTMYGVRWYWKYQRNAL